MSEAAPSILVTGGAGFIGSALVHALVARGHSVRVLDDLSTGRGERIRGLSGVDFLLGDVRSPETVGRAIAGVGAVFHLAAVASVPDSVDNPTRASEVNIHGTVVLLDHVRKRPGVRVVFASSSAVYGEARELPIGEHQVGSVITPYAVTKLACESYLSVFSRLYGVDAVSLRYFNVYGGGQDAQGAVIPAFVERIRNERPITITGDGGQTRDFVHVDDAVRANLAAMDSGASFTGECINVGTGQATTIAALGDLVGEVLGVPVKVRNEPSRNGDIRASVADPTLAKTRLGWKAEVSLRDGLTRLVSSG